TAAIQRARAAPGLSAPPFPLRRAVRGPHQDCREALRRGGCRTRSLPGAAREERGLASSSRRPGRRRLHAPVQRFVEPPEERAEGTVISGLQKAAVEGHRQPRRHLPLHAGVLHFERTLRARLPRAVRKRGRPAVGELHLRLEVQYARVEGKVTARLSLTLNGGLLQPGDYGAFRAFLGRLDEALHRRVEAAPARTAAR